MSSAAAGGGDFRQARGGDVTGPDAQEECRDGNGGEDEQEPDDGRQHRQ
jgi:hypothetical protein